LASRLMGGRSPTIEPNE